MSWTGAPGAVCGGLAVAHQGSEASCARKGKPGLLDLGGVAFPAGLVKLECEPSQGEQQRGCGDAPAVAVRMSCQEKTPYPVP